MVKSITQSSEKVKRSPREALDFLDSLQFFGMKLGLDQTGELFEFCGSPHECLRFIHVAGTNGKGSVCAMLNAALTAAGFKTGFYSSPHLISPRERIRVSGKAIGEEALADLIDFLRPRCEKKRAAGECPTYFELMTALAALHFAREKVDFVIWETGMGGRLDSTNIVSPDLSVITGISLEHQKYLGDTLEKIASEKAGIIKPGAPVFTARMPESVTDVFRKKAAACGQTLTTAPGPEAFSNLRTVFDGGRYVQEFDFHGKHIKLPLPGPAQLRNFSLAFTALESLSLKHRFSLDTALGGLERVRWPARFQALPCGTVVDGAHNTEGAGALSAFLMECFPGEKFNVVFACMPDKTPDDMLRIIGKHAAKFIFVSVKGRFQSLAPDSLGAILRRAGGPAAENADSPSEALKLAAGDGRKILVAGSLYLAGECLRILRPEDETLNIL
jgi:dihydrofolate synthase/folylpolyglutamate synthase